MAYASAWLRERQWHRVGSTPGAAPQRGGIAGERRLNHRRVVVTGMGMLTPLGASLEASWAGMVNGESGIRPISVFDTTGFPVRFGGAVPEFDMDEYLAPKDARRMDGFIQFGMVAGIQAMRDAGL